MKRLLSLVMVGLAGIQGITLEAQSRPKLVVGIMVDQLRTDYLETLKSMLSQGGFRRLMDQGVFFTDIDYKANISDAAEASAIIATGEYPRYSGITGADVYDPVTMSIRPLFFDENYIGNFTNETFSPAALKVSTLSDEIAVESGGTSKIHSIAPDAAQALVMAGHSGSSAFWINNETGKWSSSTFYPDPPATLQNKNYSAPLLSRLDTMRWTPLRLGEPYPFVSANRVKEGFKYTFPRSDRDVFYLYKQSPYINADITEAAIDYIQEAGYSSNPEVIDVLNIAYTLSPYPVGEDKDYRYELEDAYLRLDKDLERLLDSLDDKIGRENVLVYLFSTGYFDEPVSADNKYKIPGGVFSVKRAISLLNSYLAARYGNGAYIDTYFDGHIYLSKKEIEEKNLELRKVAEDAADFLIKMSGVAETYTPWELQNPSSEKLEALRLSIDPKTSGEIIMEFNPGWKVIDDSRFPAVEYSSIKYAYLSPGFILSDNIQPKIIGETVQATRIAPTIASLLRIRSPNSAKEKPVILN